MRRQDDIREGHGASAPKITLALGIVYVLVGILGFIPGITSNGLLLGIFAVNTIHNIAHLAVGAALIWGGLMASYTTTVNKTMAIVFAVLVVGSFIARSWSRCRSIRRTPRSTSRACCSLDISGSSPDPR
jgi:hypothetical protein